MKPQFPKVDKKEDCLLTLPLVFIYQAENSPHIDLHVPTPKLSATIGDSSFILLLLMKEVHCVY